jgi:hypothetical protein
MGTSALTESILGSYGDKFLPMILLQFHSFLLETDKYFTVLIVPEKSVGSQLGIVFIVHRLVPLCLEVSIYTVCMGRFIAVEKNHPEDFQNQFETNDLCLPVPRAAYGITFQHNRTKAVAVFLKMGSETEVIFSETNERLNYLCLPVPWAVIVDVFTFQLNRPENCGGILDNGV